MTRKDRLARLTALLRSGSDHQGADLAAELGVSLRTLYRDMDALAAAGVEVEGKRGVGYRVEQKIDLPPLHVTPIQMEALQLGLAAVSQSSDAELRAAAVSLGALLDESLPEAGGARFSELPRGFAHLPTIRQAIRARQKLAVTRDGRVITLRPLALDYWGRLWIIAGWSEDTRGFVEIRLDEIEALRLLPSLFVEEDGKRLSDFRAR